MADVTAPPAVQAGAPGAARAPGPGLADATRAELTKLRTLRSTFWSFLAAVFIVIGLGILITALTAANNGGTINGPQDFFLVISGSWILGQIAFLVLGIMAMTNEYATGLITNTFLATPRRPRVLLAKIAAFTGVTFFVAEVMSFANFFIGNAILNTEPFLPDTGFGGHDVLRAIIGTGIYATLIGLMGMGLGTLLHNTAASIVSGILLMLVLPGLVQILPNSWSQPITEYWPTEAGRRVYFLLRGQHVLSAWSGAADLFVFVVVLFVLGGWFMNRRDA